MGVRCKWVSCRSGIKLPRSLPRSPYLSIDEFETEDAVEHGVGSLLGLEYVKHSLRQSKVWHRRLCAAARRLHGHAH